MSGDDRAWWEEYLGDVLSNGPDYVDYPSERAQLESFAAALKWAGPLNGRRALDFGCGQGQFVSTLRALGASTLGAELLPDHVERLTRRWGTDTFVVADVGDATDWPFDPGEFDVVFSLGVLQCGVDPIRAMRDMWNLVRVGGRLVVQIGNTDHAAHRGAGRKSLHLAADADTVAGMGIGWRGIEAVVTQLPGMTNWQVAGLHPGPSQAVEVYETRKLATGHQQGDVPLFWMLAVVR